MAWIGERRMPEAAQITNYDQFLSHPDLPQDIRKRVEGLLRQSRGFTLPYESGWSVHVQWGSGPLSDPNRVFEEEVETATLTVTDRHGRVIVWDEKSRPCGKSLDHPGPRRDVPAREILQLIDEVATWSSDQWPIIDRV